MATTYNPSDKAASVTLSNGNLTASQTGTVDQGVRSTTSIAGGVVAYEVRIDANQPAFGIINSTTVLAGDTGGAGWTIFQNGTAVAVVNQATLALDATIASTTITVGDVWTLITDLTNLRFYVLRNGANIFGNFAAGTGGITITPGPWFAHWDSQAHSPDTATAAFLNLRYLPVGAIEWEAATTADVFYPLSTAAATPFFGGSLQDGGTPPTAANSAYGWTPGKLAANNFMRSRLGATAPATVTSATSLIDATSGPTVGTGSAATTAADAFVTPTALTLVYASGSWVFKWNLRATVAGAVGRLRMRVWKSVNANGSTPTELTTATQVGAIVTLSTTADTNSLITWSPGSIRLNNEFMFFQLEWNETTLGTSSTDNVFFRLGTALISTPPVEPAPTLWRSKHRIRR